MRLLLDTQIVLWWQAGGRRLGKALIHEITEAEAVFVSAVSAWEAHIKRALGKVEFPGTFRDLLDPNGFTELPVTIEHATAVESLPPIHGDPFDRLLIAQARVEDLVLVTSDR